MIPMMTNRKTLLNLLEEESGPLSSDFQPIQSE